MAEPDDFFYGRGHLRTFWDTPRDTPVNFHAQMVQNGANGCKAIKKPFAGTIAR